MRQQLNKLLIQQPYSVLFVGVFACLEQLYESKQQPTISLTSILHSWMKREVSQSRSSGLQGRPMPHFAGWDVTMTSFLARAGTALFTPPIYFCGC